MHQWWGDNVSEDKYERTFFKEGYADLSEGYNAARTAANAAGGLGTPAGDAAFDDQPGHPLQHDLQQHQRPRRWNVAPSNPTNANLFGNQTYTRLGPRATSRCAQILGKANFDKAAQGDPDARTAAARSPSRSRSRSTRSGCRTRSVGCSNKLDAVLQAVVGHGLLGSPAAGNKPQITGPGLAGGGLL